jgi:5-methylcytosine-specific restriction endonuclease McrA
VTELIPAGWVPISQRFSALSLKHLHPLFHPWLNNPPIRQQNDKKTLSHRPLDRVRKANEPKGDRTCPELLRLKGVTSHGSGDYEVDHLISLELEGSNSMKYL